MQKSENSYAEVYWQTVLGQRTFSALSTVLIYS